MPKNCPRILVRIHVDFWLGLDAPKFICRKPKWKIRLNISHRTCSIRDPTIFELSELNWRACQLTCSLNIHHKHIRHYHLLSIASFLSTRFIKDLHQTLTSVRYPHRLKGTHLHTYTYLHTPFSTYTHLHPHLTTYIIRKDSIRRPSGSAAGISFTSTVTLNPVWKINYRLILRNWAPSRGPRLCRPCFIY